MSRFNPRTHTGCDKPKTCENKIVGLFQSTHPHGVRQADVVCFRGQEKFQSTHPHGVRQCHGGFLKVDKLFQSTHPHGVRRRVRPVYIGTPMFQSTHPHGVRREHLCAKQVHRTVSIHAPTRGATPRRQQAFARWLSFNPRTHTGCDSSAPGRRPSNRGFNPRTHTGCDRKSLIYNRFCGCFNPRTHTGCDGPRLVVGALRPVSIHAPTRGATSLGLPPAGW